jgi:hypothetical protein
MHMFADVRKIYLVVRDNMMEKELWEAYLIARFDMSV